MDGVEAVEAPRGRSVSHWDKWRQRVHAYGAPCTGAVGGNAVLVSRDPVTIKLWLVS